MAVPASVDANPQDLDSLSQAGQAVKAHGAGYYAWRRFMHNKLAMSGLVIVAILCIMVPLMINRAALCGVLVAGTVSVLAYKLPYKLGLLLAVLVGMVTAMVIEETMDKIKARRG